MSKESAREAGCQGTSYFVSGGVAAPALELLRCQCKWVHHYCVSGRFLPCFCQFQLDAGCYHNAVSPLPHI